MGGAAVVDLLAFTPRPINPPGHLVTLSLQFMQHLEAHNYARNTRVAYRADLQQFVGFLLTRDISYAHLVAPALMDEFVQALTLGEGNSARTAARKVETVKRFFAWLVGRQVMMRNPCEGMARVRFMPRRVVAPEGTVLLQMINAIGRVQARDVRDYALLRVMYDAGLRVSAVCALDVYDARRPAQNAVFPNGQVHYVAKAGRHEIAVCDADTLEALAAWMDRRPRFERTASPPALFLTQRGTRFTRQAIWHLVRKRAQEAGLDHIHPHLFRHRRGAELFEVLGPRAAQAQLGHGSIQTTLDTYGQERAEKLRARIRTCPIGVTT